jgi:hypothetical protein
VHAIPINPTRLRKFPPERAHLTVYNPKKLGDLPSDLWPNFLQNVVSDTIFLLIDRVICELGRSFFFCKVMDFVALESF